MDQGAHYHAGPRSITHKSEITFPRNFGSEELLLLKPQRLADTTLSGSIGEDPAWASEGEFNALVNAKGSHIKL